MSEEIYWQAVQERDRRADGTFVYGVRSTGIYCRPSCPSRRPRREQVAFFATTAEAESAGFRACRRCQPLATHEPKTELVEKARKYIEENLDEALTLDKIGVALGVSPFHLQRTFKEVTGLSPRRYAAALKMEKLKARLKEGDSVTGALYEAGYSSSSRLYEQSTLALGMTPAIYAQGGMGVDLKYSVVETKLGLVLVAATDKGLCFLCLGDEEAPLVEATQREYPKAMLRRDDAALQEWMAVIASYVEGQEARLDLPLDMPGTPFQKEVWDKLQQIPYGETRTYTKVAQEIGRPSAVRAVARACATNPVSLVVPCHRVLREDGHLGGYRWGLDRKRRLLEQEKAVNSQLQFESLAR